MSDIPLPPPCPEDEDPIELLSNGKDIDENGNGDETTAEEEGPYAYLKKMQFGFSDFVFKESVLIKNIEDFLQIVNKLPPNSDGEEYAYRGSADFSNEFMPSQFRKNQGINREGGMDESDYYHEVLRLAPEEFANMSAFDILCKMRHYSIPNRLLDLTSNPLVALWFACNGFSSEGSDKCGKVEIVRGKFFPSDMPEVEILSQVDNVVNLYKKLEPNFLSKDRLKSFFDKKRIWYGDAGKEEEYLEAVFRFNYIGIRPTHSNIRLKAQQGLFILFGMNNPTSSKVEYSLFDLAAKPSFELPKENIKTIQIPRSAKKRLREQLEKLGFDKSRLFPELEHISEYVRGNWDNSGKKAKDEAEKRKQKWRWHYRIAQEKKARKDKGKHNG